MFLISLFSLLIAKPNWRCPSVHSVQSVQCVQCVQSVQSIQSIQSAQSVQDVQNFEDINVFKVSKVSKILKISMCFQFRVPKWNVFKDWFNVGIQYVNI